MLGSPKGFGVSELACTPIGGISVTVQEGWSWLSVDVSLLEKSMFGNRGPASVSGLVSLEPRLWREKLYLTLLALVTFVISSPPPITPRAQQTGRGAGLCSLPGLEAPLARCPMWMSRCRPGKVDGPSFRTWPGGC